MMMNEVFNPTYSASLDIRAVPATGISQLILSASDYRTGAIVFNHGTGSLFLRYSEGWDYSASFDLFTTKVSSGSSWVMPDPIYRGQVHGISDDAGAIIMVTNLDRLDPKL